MNAYAVSNRFMGRELFFGYRVINSRRDRRYSHIHAIRRFRPAWSRVNGLFMQYQADFAISDAVAASVALYSNAADDGCRSRTRKTVAL